MHVLSLSWWFAGWGLLAWPRLKGRENNVGSSFLSTVPAPRLWRAGERRRVESMILAWPGERKWTHPARSWQGPSTFFHLLSQHRWPRQISSFYSRKGDYENGSTKQAGRWMGVVLETFHSVYLQILLCLFSQAHTWSQVRVIGYIV